MAKTERKSLQGMYAKEEGVLAEFMDHMYLERMAARQTAYNYYMMLRSWTKFLVKRRGGLPCPVEDVVLSKVLPETAYGATRKDFLDYIDYCEVERRERRGYINTRISAIRSFYRWLGEREERVVPDFIENAVRLEPSTTVAVHVTPEMEQKLYEYFSNRQKVELAKRNICIVYLMLHFPLTLKEIVGLELSDINMASITLRDGDRSRELPIDEAAKAFIDSYLDVRSQPLEDGNPFFVSLKRRGRMYPGTVEKMLRVAARRALPGQYITFRDIQQSSIRNLLSKQDPQNVFNGSRIGTRRYFRRVYGEG